MPRPHPKEFRDDVVAVARRGEAPIAQIAKDFGISESCLRNWLHVIRTGFGGASQTRRMGRRQDRSLSRTVESPIVV